VGGGEVPGERALEMSWSLISQDTVYQRRSQSCNARRRRLGWLWIIGQEVVFVERSHHVPHELVVRRQHSRGKFLCFKKGHLLHTLESKLWPIPVCTGRAALVSMADKPRREPRQQ
jgi:hypothetical protein